MEILEEHDRRSLLLAVRAHDGPDGGVSPALEHVRIDGGQRPVGVGHAEQVKEDRQVLAQAVVERQQARTDLLADDRLGLVFLHPEVGPQQRQHRQQRHVLAVGDTARFVDRETAGSAALHELEAEPALARPGFGDDAHRLSVLGQSALEGGFQSRHLGGAPDELREAARLRQVEPSLQRA